MTCFLRGSPTVPVAIMAAAFALSFAAPVLADGIHVTTKSLKDATHIEISGLNEWRYDVTRKKVGDRLHVFVQLSGVAPADLQTLRTLQDARLHDVEVKAGLNGDALLDFAMNDNKLGFFDYQTETPASLILDIYRDDVPAKSAAVTAKKSKHKPSKEELLASLVEKKKGGVKGKNGRSIASVDHPEIGSQPLLAANTDPKLQLKYGIFDGGDQDLTRFKLEDGEVSPETAETALIASSRNMYLHFPMLSYNRPQLKDMLGETPNYEIGADNTDENLQVRLIVKLFEEGKYAVVLRTLKFFYAKYPETKYQKTVDFVTAETYLKLWQRDQNRADFESAMTRFKDILNKYPQDGTRFRTLMLVGLNYMDIGNNLGALSTFQVGTQTQKDSPYFWQMKMEIAEALNALDKQGASLKALSEIEAEPQSKDFGSEARYRRGDVFFQAKDYQSAIKEYKEALTKYPTNWQQGPNVYFNQAESEFWTKDYKASLDGFREFLQRFPTHPYGGYAMTRIGEILKILGAGGKKYEGAYLESYFRYHDSPGAFIAKVHLNTSRYSEMKEKELAAARAEIETDKAKITIPDTDTFVTLQEADGFTERKEFDVSQDMLVKYYQTNVLSPYLPLVKSRIVQNITQQMNGQNERGQYMKALENFIRNGDSWLKGNDRVDTKFIAGQSYEALNVPAEAATLYQKSLKAYEGFSAEQLKRENVFEMLPTPDEINLRLAKVSLKGDAIKKAGVYIANIKDPSKLKDAEQVERSLILSAVAEKEEKPDLALLALKDLSERWAGKGKDQEVLLVEPWLRMARINTNLKKYPEALTWAEKAVDLAKHNVDTVDHETARAALDLAGDLYLKTGKSASAIASYKLYIDKFADKTPLAPVKYKLGKLYFDQKDFGDASRVWDSLKDEADGDIWDKMAKEQLAQAQWNQKYGRYINRQPASQNNSGENK